MEFTAVARFRIRGGKKIRFPSRRSFRSMRDAAIWVGGVADTVRALAGANLLEPDSDVTITAQSGSLKAGIEEFVRADH